MRKSLIVLGCAAALAMPRVMHAQQCGTGPVGEACERSRDLFQYVAPQLGLAITGGNATLGTGSTLGGLGHFTVGARANVIMNGRVPDVGNFPAPSTLPGQNPQPQTLPTTLLPIALPAVDAAIGVYGGFPLGVTNVGGVDLLLSAIYVPTLDRGGVSITPETNLKIGYGARVGLIQESLLLPGVSVTYLRRDLPTTTLVGDGGGATLTVADASIKTTAWRLVAGKNLLLFSLAAGVGQDSYDQSATISAAVGGAGSTPTTVSQSLSRTNAFVDAAMHLPFFRLVAEVGTASGGTVTTFNNWPSGEEPDRRLVYLALGARFNW